MGKPGQGSDEADKYFRLADIILALEMRLRESGLWELEAPSNEALASQAPFCIDTLNFTQWLQFVFVERIKLIIETRAPLPASSGLVPMAEEYFVTLDSQRQDIIKILQKFDDLIGASNL